MEALRQRWVARDHGPLLISPTHLVCRVCKTQQNLNRKTGSREAETTEIFPSCRLPVNPKTTGNHRLRSLADLANRHVLVLHQGDGGAERPDASRIHNDSAPAAVAPASLARCPRWP